MQEKGGFSMVIHVVQPGDSLYRIAQLHSVPLPFLIQQNELHEPYRLTPGQTIVVPQPEKTYIVRRGDTVEAGAMIAKEGKKNIKGGDKTHYTHVELRKGRHTSSSPYRDIVLTSDCPYAVMQQALGVVESGRQPITAAAALTRPPRRRNCRSSTVNQWQMCSFSSSA